MNRIFKLVALAALFCTGCATFPEGDGPRDPNPYSSYRPAMQNEGSEHPQAAVWQEDDRAKIDAATKKEVLAKIFASEASADAFLRQIKGAYDTDPIVATQAAAVTQLLMNPNWHQAAKPRALWVAALKKALVTTNDAYRKAFFRDQLRQCGVR